MTFAEWLAYERTFGPRERWERAKEKAAMFVAWHLLPVSVRRWVIVRAHAARTQGEYGNVHPDTVKAFDLYC